MRLGQKIRFNGMEGYLIGMTINPLEESEVPYERCTYTIRVFKPFYKDGYADFRRSVEDLFESYKEERKAKKYEEG